MTRPQSRTSDADVLARWLRLVPAPPAPPDPIHWPTVHAELGTSLPDDYRRYLDVYGLGCVNGLYWVTHPHAEAERLNLSSQWAVHEPGPLLMPPPHPLGIIPGGLAPCAVDEDGGVVYWHTSSPDPDRWTVVYRDEDGDAWRPYGLGLVAFLLEVFTGALPELGYAAAGYLTRPLRFTPLLTS